MDQQLAESILLRPPGQSRFILLDRPIAHPGICRVCGAANKPVVDFGQTDDEGCFYFCTDCLTEVAKGALNLVDASDLEVARLTATHALHQRDMAGELVNGYIHTLNNLHDDLISGLRNLPGVDDSVSEDIPAQGDGQGYREIPNSVFAGSSISDSAIDEGPISVSDGSSDGPGESEFSV